MGRDPARRVLPSPTQGRLDLGDGGLGQYLAGGDDGGQVRMDITHLVLDNGQLGKILAGASGRQLGRLADGPRQPDFAAYTDLCGGLGIRVREGDDLDAALERALAHPGFSLVEAITDPLLV
ncbi:MAG: thiamine pyrophosphate-dependent enzyme [Thermoanaerobaculia bacterium]